MKEIKRKGRKKDRKRDTEVEKNKKKIKEEEDEYLQDLKLNDFFRNIVAAINS